MKIQLEISNDFNAEALAVFCKRITFDDAYNKADGDTEVERKAMAYRMLRAFSELETALAEAGFSPR